MRLLSGMLLLYAWIIILRAFASWLEPDPRNGLWRLMVRVTEPVLRPLRRLVPPQRSGGFDISPLLAVLLIVMVRALLF